MTVRALWHFSFHVSDLDRSVQFYSEMLGMELVLRQDQSGDYTARLVGYRDARLRVAQLRIGERSEGSFSTHDLELVEYSSPRVAAAPIERARPGTAHLAFVVDDLANEYERLTTAGVDFVSPPNEITSGVNRGGACCYFLDPDGITLELVQPHRHSWNTLQKGT